MNEIDVFLLLLLAIADVALFAFLRRRRKRLARLERMIVSLQLHLRRSRWEPGHYSGDPVSMPAK